MSFVLDWLRRAIRKPPVAIFLISVCLSSLTGYGYMYVIASSHQSTLRSDFLHLKTDRMSLEFPKNWVAFKGAFQNESGSFSTVVSFNPVTGTFFGIQLYDENATRFLWETLSFTDTSSVVMQIVNDTYAAVLKDNNSSLLIFQKNDTMKVSNLDFTYSIITVTNVPGGTNNYYNLTRFIGACLHNRELILIFFTSDESRWLIDYEIFQAIINLLRVG
ncbi:MAG: hypothetical protein RMJ07_06225 [Nitrososphaerota archaeon]|nr:hypothetical protein [Candidatus Bathyarchaeota archaeon]MDW8049256.1 hypothetical protein [Nitrososphaerota archaeon]